MPGACGATSQAVLPDCLCVPGLMDELARQANTRAGVDIGAILRGCNTEDAAAAATATDAVIINHAEVLGGEGGGSCAAAARARVRRQEGVSDSPQTERFIDDMDINDMDMERKREREREREYDPLGGDRASPSSQPPNRRADTTDTAAVAVAIGTTVVVDESDTFSAALAGEYPAVVDPNPPYATSASGTGAALIEDGVFEVYAAFSNLGESLRTAAYVWAERAAQQHLENQRRERAAQAVFLRRMSGLMLEASHDLEASARGVPLLRVGAAGTLTAQGVSGVGGPVRGGRSGGGRGGPARRGNATDGSASSGDLPRSSSPWWPLWTWEGLFREA